jgi:hypothetical protein
MSENNNQMIKNDDNNLVIFMKGYFENVSDNINRI